MHKKIGYEEILGKSVVEDFENNYSSPSFDTFVAGKSTVEDEALYDSPYEEGFISNVDEDQDTFLVSDDPNDFNINRSNLYILSSIDSDKFNVYNLDIRYSDIIKNAKEVFVKKSYKSLIDYKNIIDNFIKNASPKSSLYLKNLEKYSSNIKKICDDNGLKYSNIDKNNQRVVRISQSKKKKTAFIYSSNKMHSFSCDLADTESLKIKGLQGRDYLKKDHGMIFSYASPQAVMFHMGTVKFPIDILFIDENNMIKKISSNIMPNSLGVYSANSVKNVLEIPGGYCDYNNIKEGDYVVIDNYKKSVGEFSFKEMLSSVLAVDLDDILKKYSVAVSSKGSSGFTKIASDAAFNLNINSYSSPESRDISMQVRNIDKSLMRDSAFDKIVFYHNNLAGNDSIDIITKKALDILDLSSLNYDIVMIPDYFNKKEIYSAIKNKFSAEKVFFAENGLEKVASFTIDDDVKKSALAVVKTYEKILLRIVRFKKLLDKNKNAYEKIKDNYDAIKSSKGRYSQSVKRLSKDYKAILNGIKKCIQQMNKIKDVQTVEEINSVIVISTKNCSDKVKDLFEMGESLGSLEFFVDFQKKTEDSKKIFEDLSLNIKRMREFIYSNILGKTIISE